MTDRGGEYIDTLYFQSVGIIHETTAPYTPQQNGISERKNRLLKEMVNSMLSYSGLGQGFYGEAIGNVDSVPKLKTLGERGIESIFVGYAENSKAFRNWWLSGPKEVLNRLVPQLETCRIRKEIWNRTRSKDFGPGFQLYFIEGTRYEVSDQHSYCFNIEDDPKTFDEAKKSQDVDLTKEFLPSRFSMKDGEADIILGIRIKHESNGIAISQSHYIEKILKKFNYFDCTPVSTPIDTSEKLMPNNGQAVSQLEYSRVIGYLMYAMTYTRPDIDFVVGKMSRYTSNPGTQHWQEIQRILKYLKKTMDHRLTYTGYPSVLEGYTDASWISNTEDNSSTSGWLLVSAGKEAEWSKNLLLEIPLWSKLIAPISIRCDSAATLAKAYSQMYNWKSRHLGVRHSMIRELITNGVISIEFVRSQQNLAKYLTKGLARDLVIKSAEGMILKSN
ncbi:zinc finger, CCHC-type containing protein [Tanacetum coccineum]